MGPMAALKGVVLALDTTGASTEVGWWQGGRGGVQEAAGQGRDEALWQLIERCLADAGQPVGLVAVSAGPGSYTGTRIGLAAAEGLSMGWAVPRLAVPTFAAWAEGVAVPGPLLVGRGDGRGMVIWQSFAGSPRVRRPSSELGRGEPRAVVEEASRLGAHLVVADWPGEVPADCPLSPAPGVLAVASWAWRHRGDLKDAPFAPIYLRPAARPDTSPA